MIDRLAAFFILIIAAVSGCVAIYATGYVEHMHGGSRRHLLCAFANLFILSMVLVVASGTTCILPLLGTDGHNPFFLVMYEYDYPDTKKAGIFYFVMTQLSTLFVLLGVIILYGQTGTFAFTRMPVPGSLFTSAAFLCLFLGVPIKAGIIPFHKWLPYAHPASPSPISALMSGVMLNIAVYGLVRFLLFVFAPDLWWGVLILAAGTVLCSPWDHLCAQGA